MKKYNTKNNYKGIITKLFRFAFSLLTFFFAKKNVSPTCFYIRKKHHRLISYKGIITNLFSFAFSLLTFFFTKKKVRYLVP